MNSALHSMNTMRLHEKYDLFVKTSFPTYLYVTTGGSCVDSWQIVNFNANKACFDFLAFNLLFSTHEKKPVKKTFTVRGFTHSIRSSMCALRLSRLRTASFCCYCCCFPITARTISMISRVPLPCRPSPCPFLAYRSWTVSLTLPTTSL